MAVKTYRATAKGYIDGRVIEEDEVFRAEFKTLVRDDKGAIKRDDDGEAVFEPAKEPPSWAEEIPAKDAKRLEAAQEASDPNRFDDPNLTAMSKSALQAYAAERNVPFDASTSKDDLIAAIRAAAELAT